MEYRTVGHLHRLIGRESADMIIGLCESDSGQAMGSRSLLLSRDNGVRKTTPWKPLEQHGGYFLVSDKSTH